MIKICSKTVDEILTCICDGEISTYAQLEAILQASPQIPATKKEDILEQFFKHKLDGCDLPLETEVEDCDGNITTEEAQAVAVKGIVRTKSCDPSIDIEKTGWVCRNGTKQNLVCTFTDGVKTNEEWIDSGIGCDEEFPTDVEIFYKKRCDLTTNTIWEQPTFYAPTDSEDPTTTQEVAMGIEYDTGISCESLIQDVKAVDCDGNDLLIRAVPVVTQGTGSVKECNSDALLDVEVKKAQILNDILESLNEDDTDDDLRRDFELTNCRVVGIDGNQIDGWTVWNVEVKDEFANVVEERQVVKLNGVENPLPRGATVTCIEENNSQTECRKSQEVTFAFDNTGFSKDATLEIGLELSDGQYATFIQPPQASFTAQTTQWVTEIQSIFANLGIVGFVESRFINNSDPSDTSGNTASGNPSGLNGVPSAKIGQLLDAGGIIARYVNVQSCPDQPAIVSVELLSVNGVPRSTPRFATAVGPLLGDVNRYQVCTSCGEEDVWYIYDDTLADSDKRLATPSEIPNCWWSCSEPIPSPPKPNCSTVKDEGCDSANDTEVVRLTTFCSGTPPIVEFYEELPDGSLQEHTLIGQFVDCEDGTVVADQASEERVETATFIDCYTDGAGNYKKGIRVLDVTNPVAPFVIGSFELDRITPLDTSVWTVEEDKCNCGCGC